ncbi:MAG TPA: acetate kinase [Pseudothermotoga sp.]|nr:acetate kinase [Pseudothermotoga sp.]HOK83901.1 acetate kinase [Pseudothermotoga sp.]HPP70713.1 acetate kinase [Pseudothermotoga sp.]
MKILVVNCGSSSVKYQFVDMKTEKVLCKGLAERVGIEGSRLVHRVNADKHVIEKPMKDHEEALKLILEVLLDPEIGVIKDLSEISAVGHRVVHGAERFASSVLIDDEVMRVLEENVHLAPLHNPPNIMGIRAVQKLLPNVPNVGVFDTAFHQSMPKKAFLYPIPYEFYEKYRIRRYGFHGTSHRYVSRRAAEILSRDYYDFKVITCHLGNGASIAAVRHGKSVDTSMGFTPLEGVVMGTRSGDIDPAIVIYMQQNLGLPVDKVYDTLNKKSGMLGLSQVSSDMRDIEEAAFSGNEMAQMALDIYVYRIAKYIGAYAAAMNGVDAIVFTAGVGENSPYVREKVCEYLGFLGVKLDKNLNQVKGTERVISTPDSKVAVLIVPTDEELVIARDTKQIVESGIKELKLF